MNKPRFSADSSDRRHIKVRKVEKILLMFRFGHVCWDDSCMRSIDETGVDGMQERSADDKHNGIFGKDVLIVGVAQSNIGSEETSFLTGKSRFVKLTGFVGEAEKLLTRAARQRRFTITNDPTGDGEKARYVAR